MGRQRHIAIVDAMRLARGTGSLGKIFTDSITRRVMTQQRASDDAAFGALLATHRNEHFFRLTGNTIGTLLAAGGLLVFWFSTQDVARYEYAGNAWMLGAAGIGAVVLGFAIGWGIRRVSLAQQTYRLYQSGIRTSGPDGRHAALYRDIEDILYFDDGTCAFRNTPQQPWILIGKRIRQCSGLTHRLRYLHREQRAAKLVDRLRAGETLTFRYLDDKAARSVSHGVKYFEEYPTFVLTMDERRVHIGQKIIDIKHIDVLSFNRWTNSMTIRSKKDGSDFHKMHAKAILSGEVLHFMIFDMQARRRKEARRLKKMRKGRANEV
ncbi:hypothetical protein [Massilia rubra]|uniref:Uncharacterized protein n=1 Tax=Massilia rubra TaxID=2607910 RepID=A0ABX0LPW8_9BURK|nr:hypothetical protein [Massilia rubra]NHZ34247.1 hypothetical protein [Massilia rubra]